MLSVSAARSCPARVAIPGCRHRRTVRPWCSKTTASRCELRAQDSGGLLLALQASAAGAASRVASVATEVSPVQDRPEDSASSSRRRKPGSTPRSTRRLNSRPCRNSLTSSAAGGRPSGSCVTRSSSGCRPNSSGGKAGTSWRSWAAPAYWRTWEDTTVAPAVPLASLLLLSHTPLFSPPPPLAPPYLPSSPHAPRSNHGPSFPASRSPPPPTSSGRPSATRSASG